MTHQSTQNAVQCAPMLVSLRKNAPLLLLSLMLACTPKQMGCEATTEGEEGKTSVPKKVVKHTRRKAGPSIEYTLRFPNAHQHYIEVSAVFPVPKSKFEISMAVWTPGSYMVREYARNVEALSVTSLEGSEVVVAKSTKNRWRIDAGELKQVVVRYRLYANELTVRTNFVDADWGVLNGAPTFFTIAKDSQTTTAPSFDIMLKLPERWKESVTALPRAGNDNNHYVAVDFDELVDSPIIVGTPTIDRFEAAGIPHTFAAIIEGRGWDEERALADVQRIVEEQNAFWGVTPYETYTFLNILSNGGRGMGGLEHLHSTLMMGYPEAGRDEKNYRKWLGLVSHEFFHTWNVKRLRPKALGPFDYEVENHTHSLWIAEGITSYYDDLLLRRAGLLTKEEYLGTLGDQIKSVQTTPGRLVQPLSAASFDAWIKFYRPDENSINTAISYYRKGAMVAFLLDAEIRKATEGSKSLDDVMRSAYETYSGESGYTTEEFRSVVNTVADTDLSPFFKSYVDGTDELEWKSAFDYFGLAFVVNEDDSDDDSEGVEPGYLGVVLDGSIVEKVLRDTPGFSAGLNVDDELIAFDNERFSGDLDKTLSTYRPEEKVELTISRRKQLKILSATLSAAPSETYEVEVKKNASGTQRRRVESWLGAP